MSKQQLIQQAEQIRDEYRIGANSAERVGNALLAIIHALSEADVEELSKFFLRKDREDTATRRLTLLGGVKVGKEAYINEKGNAVLKELSLEDIKGLFAEFDNLKVDKGNIAELVLIKLLVKALAEVKDLKVNDTAIINDATIEKKLSSLVFTSGFLGEGFRLAKTESGDWNLEIDNLTVRKVFQVFELLIQEVKHQGGVVVHSPAGGKITKVTDGGSYWRCEIESADTFFKDDLVLCQRFTGKVKRYWRAVTSAGDGYINLSKTDCEANSALPEVDDEIATLGNKTNTARQSAYLISVVGADAPYTAYYSGINSYSLKGKEHTRIGNLEGVVSPAFGSLKGSGALLENAYIQGMIKLQNGKSVETVINETSNKLSGDIGKAQTDLQKDINTSVNSVKSELGATITNVENNFNTSLNSTKNELNSSISKVQGDADTAKGLAQSAQDAVDGLEIGGRNLIAISRIKVGYRLNPSDGELVSTANAQVLESFFEVGSSKYISVSRKPGTKNNFGDTNTDYLRLAFYDENKLFIKAHLEEKNPLPIIIIIPKGSFYFRVSSSRFDLENLKIEFGNKPTDWTPAPEDTEAQISKSKEEAEAAAKAYADAQDNLKQIESKAYADGKVTAEEKRAIADAKAKLDAAKAYSDAKDALLKTQQEAYADGKITAEEQRAIEDAKAKLEAAKKYADAQDALLKTQQEAYADGIVTEAEQRAINEAQNRVDKAKEELNALIEGVKETVTKEIKDVEQRFEIADGQINSHIKETTQLVTEAKLANGESIKTLEQVKVQINDINVTAGKINTTLGEVTKKQGEINSSISNLEQTAGSISASIEGFKETEQQIKATANKIEASHEGIVLEASEKSAQKAIDGLEIGGRNLISGSGGVYLKRLGAYGRKIVEYNGKISVLHDRGTMLHFAAKTTDTIKKGGSYVYSFKMCCNEGIVKMASHIYINGKEGSIRSVNDTEITTEWKMFYISSVAKGDIKEVAIHHYLAKTLTDTDQIVYLTEYKLEKGTKPTDWTPAPEDIDAQFTETKASLKVLNDQLVAEVSKTNGISKDLTAVKQDHNSFKVQVKTDITGAINSNNEVVKSSFEMKEDTISLLGKSIVLTGKITFNSLENSVKSKINNTELVANQAKSNATTALSNIAKVKDEIPNENYLYEKNGEFLLSENFPRTGDHKVTLSIWGDFSGYQNKDPYDEIMFQGSGDRQLGSYKYKWKSDNHIVYEGGTLNLYDDSDPNIVVSLGFYEGTDIEVRAVKLEMGDKATYWTPSPEDTIGLAKLDETIIDGGFIKTSLIRAGSITADKLDVNSIFANRISTGNLTVTTGGEIGGFKVQGYGLTNTGFDNDAYIIIRKDSENSFAGIGANVFPATFGAAGAARFEITKRKPLSNPEKNIALRLESSGCALKENNVALSIGAGFIEGFAIKVTQINSSYTADQYDCFISCYNTSQITVRLPSNPTLGRVVYVSRNQHAHVEVSGNGKSIRKGSGTSSSIPINNNGEICMFIFDDKVWQYAYMQN